MKKLMLGNTAAARGLDKANSSVGPLENLFLYSYGEATRYHKDSWYKQNSLRAISGKPRSQALLLGETPNLVEGSGFRPGIFWSQKPGGSAVAVLSYFIHRDGANCSWVDGHVSFAQDVDLCAHDEWWLLK